VMGCIDDNFHSIIQVIIDSFWWRDAVYSPKSTVQSPQHPLLRLALLLLRSLLQSLLPYDLAVWTLSIGARQL
jgi:hypothetical protein